MSQTLPDPVTNPELFDSLLRRRVGAYIIDAAIIVGMAVGVSLVGVIAGFLTLGVGWLAIPFLVPFAVLAYYAATLGSPSRGRSRSCLPSSRRAGRCCTT